MAGARQARRGGLEPLVVDVVLRDQDGGAAVGQLVRDAVGLELVDDGVGVRGRSPENSGV